MIDGRAVVGSHDILLVTLDTLRYDVAEDCLRAGTTPNLASVLPGGRWEMRHTTGSFTYSAHQAFFAGFLPTPSRPGIHRRLFALRFEGSETTGPDTCVFDAPTIVEGLAASGYRTVCIGGVGFFNKRTPLGCVLPSLFQESHWSPDLGVTCRDSTAHQVALARQILAAAPGHERLFLFVNVSAIHQPNCHYLPNSREDSCATQAAALAYVDGQLAGLFNAAQRRAPTLCIVCSDHGTAYGEDGYRGHRCALPCVWTVPYAEFVLAKAGPIEREP